MVAKKRENGGGKKEEKRKWEEIRVVDNLGGFWSILVFWEGKVVRKEREQESKKRDVSHNIWQV